MKRYYYKLEKIFGARYKKRPKKKGYKHLFYSAKTGKRVKFRPYKFLIVYRYKRIYIKPKKTDLFIVSKKIVEKYKKWISLKEYLNEIIQSFKDNGFVIKGEIFYKKNINTDVIYLKDKFVWDKKVKLPILDKGKIYTIEKGWHWIKYSDCFRVISIYYFFIDKREKRVIFHRRNEAFDFYLTYDELKEYANKLFQKVIEQYNNSLYPKDFFGLVCYTGYLGNEIIKKK